MSEIEKFKMKISTGNDIIDNRVSSNFRILNLNKVISIIEDRVQDDGIRSILKESASSYPHQALESFVRNLDRHISNAIKKLKDNKN